MLFCLNYSLIVILGCTISTTRTYIVALPFCLASLKVYVRQEDLHPSGPLAAEHIGLVLHHALLAPDFVLGSLALGVLAGVVKVELRAQKVGSHFAKIGLSVLLHLIVVRADHVMRSR